MKKNRIILIFVLLFCLILVSCEKNNNASTDTTESTPSIISTLTTAEAKYDFYKNAYEKTIALQQIAFNQKTTLKETTDIMTVDSSIENDIVYKKTESGFDASGLITTTIMDSSVVQNFYYTNNATYLDEDGDKTKEDGDFLNIATWNNNIISKIDFEGVSEISCIQAENGIKITIIGEITAFDSEQYQGSLSDYIDENTYVKSYRLTAVVNNDGYIVSTNDILSLEEQRQVTGLDDYIVNQTITTNLIISVPGSDVTVTPLDNYESYGVTTTSGNVKY